MRPWGRSLSDGPARARGAFEEIKADPRGSWRVDLPVIILLLLGKPEETHQVSLEVRRGEVPTWDDDSEFIWLHPGFRLASLFPSFAGNLERMAFTELSTGVKSRRPTIYRVSNSGHQPIVDAAQVKAIEPAIREAGQLPRGRDQSRSAAWYPQIDALGRRNQAGGRFGCD
jgi:hypothetical protein